MVANPARVVVSRLREEMATGSLPVSCFDACYYVHLLPARTFVGEVSARDSQQQRQLARKHDRRLQEAAKERGAQVGV